MYSLIIIGITLFGVYESITRPTLDQGVKWLIFAFFLGYRTITLVPGFLIHPMDLILVALCVKSFTLQGRLAVKFPPWLLLLFPFTLWAIYLGLQSGFQESRVWWEFKNFMLIYLVFQIFRIYIKTEKQLERIAYYTIWTMNVIAIFGLLEYYVPGVRGLLGSFYSSTAEVYAEDTVGFRRGAFTFWGSVTVGHIIVTTLPLLLIIPQAKTFLGSHRNLMVFSLLLTLLSSYITGNRADWLFLIILAFLYYFVYLGNRITKTQLLGILGLSVIGIVAVGVLFTSEAFWARFVSGLSALTFSETEELRAIDSSGYERQQRLLGTIHLIQTNPWGVGWTVSGWTHTDFLQFIANMGWLPGGLILISFIGLGVRSLTLIYSGLIYALEKRVLISLIMCYSGVGFMMLINNNYILTQTGVPMFMLWAFLYVYEERIQKRIHYERRRSLVKD